MLILDLERFADLFGEDDGLPIVYKSLDVAILGLRWRISSLFMVLVRPGEVVLSVRYLRFDRLDSLAIIQVLISLL